MDVDVDATGLSQQLAEHSIAAPPGLSSPASATSPSPTTRITLEGNLLREFIEAEVLQHFELIQAISEEPGARQAAQLAIQVPQSWADMQLLFKKLAYDPVTSDPWRRLGLAMMSGKDPTPMIIAARVRTARLLHGLAGRGGWSQLDVQAAADFMAKIEEASTHCEAELPSLLKERKKLKVPQLPLHKELGEAAISVLNHPPADGGQLYLLTQWSNLFRQPCFTEEIVTAARGIGALAEKGDSRLWEWAQGKHVVLWAPEDHNALTRCLASFLRLGPDQRPRSCRLVTTVGLLPGMTDFARIADLWWHPLLAEKWTPLMRGCQVTPLPMEWISSGPAGPRLGHSGLAIFSLSLDGPRVAPHLHLPQAPLLHRPSTRAVTVDLQADDLPVVFQLLQGQGFEHSTLRLHRRSPLSTKEVPRVCLDVLFSPESTDLYILMLFQRLRQHGLPVDTYWAMQDVYGSPDAYVFEASSPANLARFWPLCTQLLAVTRTKLLVITTAEGASWTSIMDAVLQEDASETSFRLKWKASRNGGRSIAVPSATEAALAAGRRRGNTRATPSDLDYVTDLIAMGELGKEDGEVLRYLMRHLCTATGLQIEESAYTSPPRVGEYVHLARIDSASPPGRLRLFLPDLESVRKLRAALHGQSVQVGSDLVGFRITNDRLDAEGLPGGATRHRP